MFNDYVFGSVPVDRGIVVFVSLGIHIGLVLAGLHILGPIFAAKGRKRIEEERKAQEEAHEQALHQTKAAIVADVLRRMSFEARTAELQRMEAEEAARSLFPLSKLVRDRLQAGGYLGW